MAQGDEEEAEVEDPAEDPDPLIALEKALEKDDLAGKTEHHSALGHGGWRRGDLERRGRARVLDYDGTPLRSGSRGLASWGS